MAAEPEQPKAPAEAPAETVPAKPEKPAGPEKDKPGLFGPGQPQDIVVTGSRVPTEQKHAGASVSVVSGEELERRRPVAAWEAVRFTPSATFVQTGTTGQATSLFMRGGESDHTMVLLDGFKVNNDGGDFPWETLATTGIGRIEVMRGVGSPLYGADGLTGVVQAITERGSGPASLGLSAEAGNLGQFRETVRLQGEDGPFAYNLNLARYDLTDGRFDNSDVRTTTFAGRIDWDMPSGVHAELVQHAVGQESGNYESDAIEDPNAVVRHRRELTGLVFEGRIAELVDSRLLLGRSQIHYLYEDDLDAADTVYYRTTRDLERLTGEWQNSAQIYEFGPAVGRLTAGVAWEEELGRVDAEASGGATSANYVDRTRTARSIFAEKRLELWKALTIDAGVRTEDHSTYGTKTTSRVAGALWIEQTGTKLHASWGQGIKSPTFFENFDDSFYDLGGLTTYTTGNPDLDPERVISEDAGIEQHLFGDRVVAGVTVFRNRYKDFINFEFGFPNSTYVNAGRARAQGFEYELGLKPVRWARARGTFTVTNTEAITDASSANFADGRPLIRRPGRVITGILEVEPLAPAAGAPDWARRLSLFGEVVHQADTVDVDWNSPYPYDRVWLPDFTVFNTGLDWEVLKMKGHSLRLIGRWDNVCDVEVEQVKGITGNGSSFLAGLNYTVEF